MLLLHLVRLVIIGMEIELSIVDYKSPYFGKVIHLRNDILRKPIGLNLNDEDLSEEKDQYVIIAVSDDEVIGCVMLKIIDQVTCKLRQMAVNDAFQSKGVGTLLVRYAENFCFLNSYFNIELHARKTAVPFYTKLGYSLIIDEFEEVGLPHYKMFKKIELDAN